MVLQAPPPHDDVLWHLMWVVLPIVITIGAGQVITFFANRKRGREKDNALGLLLNEYRLHDHGEYKDADSTGPLKAEGLRFPRTHDNDK